MTKKEKIEQELSDYNNSLRFFTANGFKYEIVGTHKTKSSWAYDIKMPYSKLDTKSRYEQLGEKELFDLIKKNGNEHLVKHYKL